MAERLDPSITTWRKLIHTLAARHHDGHYYPIAARVRVSAGLVDQWKRGVVRTPSLTSVMKVARAYDLELIDLVALAGGRRMSRPISGGSSADGTPPLSIAEALSLLSDIVRRWLRHPWVARPAYAPTV